MPQRAKVSRVCFFRNGISSGAPSDSGCVRPSRRPASKSAVDVAGLHRPVGDPAGLRLDFDHRLQPVEPARAVANDLGVEAARVDLLLRRPRRPCRRRAPAAPESRGTKIRTLIGAPPRTSSSIRASSSRPITSPVEHRRRASRRRARGNRPARGHRAVGRGLVPVDAERLEQRARTSGRRPSTGRLRRGRPSARDGRPACAR